MTGHVRRGMERGGEERIREAREGRERETIVVRNGSIQHHSKTEC